VGWGYENRTAALRIPAGPHAAGRIGHRAAGAEANPYLVLSAIMGGALDGIVRNLAPTDPVRSNSHALDLPTLARDWRQALEWFSAADANVRNLHPESVSCFAACKQQEQDVFASRMTDFELSTNRVTV